MFTGIIEELGTLDRLEPRSAGGRITVRCRKVLEDSELGSSISVNGVCLTAAELRADSFSADVAPETLRRSNLGTLRMGSPVNLERPSRRMDGSAGISCKGTWMQQGSSLRWRTLATAIGG